ncbi:MAG: hypothetical protein PVJ60_07565, partial [Phycisphaerales bacterium]
MANRRLNKKVALVGSVIFVFVVLGVILAIFHLGRNPKELIKDAEATLNAAHEATDETLKEQHYKRAESSFRSAYGRAKTSLLREEILFKMIDMYLEIKEWPFILGCWDEIIRINPNNVKARYGRLTYFYILADSGALGVWQEVQEQATEFLEIAEKADLLMEDTAQWDVFGTEHKKAAPQALGPYLYLVRGKAILEMASLGAVTNRNESLAQAVEDLEKVLEYEPDNIDAYWYLARASVIKGEIFASRGSTEERDEALDQAITLLEQSVQVAEANPEAHVNLLRLKLVINKDGDPALLKKKLQSLESEYLTLVRNFSSSAIAYAAISQFYSVYANYSGPELGLEILDKAIEAIEQAIKLDEKSVTYAINAANLHYRRFSFYKQRPQIYKAMETAKKALTLPDAQDVPGPRHR